MLAADLVELAALVAQHGPALVVGTASANLTGVEEYWAASKCRFDRWQVMLGRLRRGESPLCETTPATAYGLVEEILGSEVLTRVWTAVVVAFDHRRDAQDNEIVVRSVHIGHLEMRQRVLKLLLDGPGLTSTQVVELNRLRRRAEQWTDLLLAPLSLRENIGDLAFESERMRAYSTDMSPEVLIDGGCSDPRAFLPATIRSVARFAFRETSPNLDLNARVAASIISAFSPDLFDSLGLLRSAWSIRLAQTATDAQRLVSELFMPPSASTLSTSPTRRFH